MTYHRLAFAFASFALPFLAAGPVGAQAAGAAGLTVEPCTLRGIGAPARCGTLEVWENREARSGRRISIRFVVVPSRGSGRAREAVVSIPGGPGQSAVDLAPHLARELEALRDERDILLVDHRGTGGDNLLRCQIFGPPDSLRAYVGAFYPAHRVAECAKQWEGRADLAQYTSDPAADDLDEVRAALGYDRLTLVGGSYGTRAVLAYLRRHPERARAAVLNGTVPVDVRYPLTLARDAQRALDGVFADCRAEPACDAAFPDLPGSLRRALARFSGGPLEVAIMHPETGRPASIPLSRDLFVEAVRYLTYSVGHAALVPAMVHQAGEGDFQPIAEFGLSSRRSMVGGSSDGLFLSLTCSEDVAFFTLEEGRSAAAGTYLGDYRVRDQKAACAAWPVGPVDAEFHQPVRSSVPVLLVSGEWDPATPPANAEHAMRTLSNARHVVVPHGAHSWWGLEGAGECVPRIVEQFVRAADHSGLDVSCVRSIRRAPFPTARLGGVPVDVPAERLARFVGRYRSPELWLEVKPVDGGIVAVGPDESERRLIPLSETRFQVGGEPFSSVTFVEDGGRVTALRLQVGGGTAATLDRVP